MECGLELGTVVRLDRLDLERLGLVWRATATGNRRAYAVEVTPAGLDLLADASKIVDKVSEDLLAEVFRRRG